MKATIVLFCCLFGGVLSQSDTTCAGRCGNSLDSSKQCQCNDACTGFGDCCTDYEDVCTGTEPDATCEGRCGNSLDSSKPCQCNDACTRFGDCCTDHGSVCSGDVGTKAFTDEDLRIIGNMLWTVDDSRFNDEQLVVDIGGITNSSSSLDQAPNKLFQHVDAERLKLPSYSLFIDLLDNYNSTSSQPEPELTAQEQDEVDAYLNHTIKTPVMRVLCDVLFMKGHIESDADFRDLLVRLWFDLYARSSSSSAPIDSSGFEHVFVGEFNTTSITGFHNWVQMYLLEHSGALNYRGYNSIAEPDVIETIFVWNGLPKKRGSLLLGTSPEFDMAVYTLCIVARSGQNCELNIDGSTLHILTFDVSHKSGLQVASAFPSVTGV